MIIVFGALNIDIIMSVSQFPETGETVIADDYATRSGGKGSNQAMASTRAGAKTAMVGKVGDDAFGRRAMNNLKSQSVLGTGIGISERPTGCATIWVDESGQNKVLLSCGANLDATADQIPDEILTERNTVLVQWEVPEEETFMLIRRAAERGARTILNAAPAVAEVPDDILDMLDYLILNDIEAKQLAAHQGFTQKKMESIAAEFAKRGQLTCIITLGEDGVLAATPDRILKMPALDVEVVDTTGAGDCFCGVFAAYLEQRHDLVSALKAASAAAALSCRVLGAQAGIPFDGEIDEYMGSLPDPEEITL